jgi:hypothetical protein
VSPLVAVVGLLMLGIGLAVLVSPAVLRDLLHRFLEYRWVYWVSGLRVLAGAVLVIAAPTTKLPDFILLLGVLLLAAGTSLPFLGKERVDRMAEWWLRLPNGLLRLWGTLATALGGVVAWAAF